MGQRILVTGGNGFVGGAISDWLSHNGFDVVSAVRRPGTAPGQVMERVIEDPYNPRAWAATGSGCIAVVHTIGRSHKGTRGNAESFRRVNVGITQALLAGMPDVARFCYISSIKAVGEGAPAPYDEHSACFPQDAYGRSKLAAEAELLGSDLRGRVVILRPPLVHGPGVKGNLRRLIAAVQRGVPLPLGRATAPRSTISLEALAEAVRTVLSPLDVPEILHVAHPEAPSVRQTVQMIGIALGKAPLLIDAPPQLLRAVALPVRATGVVDRLFEPLVVDPSRIQSLGWAPPRPLSVTVGEAAVAYRDRNASG